MELICTDEEGFRPVNKREAEVLKYTFGIAVGNFLINIIKIEYDPLLAKTGKGGRVVTDREIKCGQSIIRKISSGWEILSMKQHIYGNERQSVTGQVKVEKITGILRRRYAP